MKMAIYNKVDYIVIEPALVTIVCGILYWLE